jgi:hypothetical protein
MVGACWRARLPYIGLRPDRKGSGRAAGRFATEAPWSWGALREADGSLPLSTSGRSKPATKPVITTTPAALAMRWPPGRWMEPATGCRGWREGRWPVTVRRRAMRGRLAAGRARQRAHPDGMQRRGHAGACDAAPIPGLEVTRTGSPSELAWGPSLPLRLANDCQPSETDVAAAGV